MNVDNSIKQVIVMRKDLNMRKGKMCAQAAHASNKILLSNYTLDSESAIGGVNVICKVEHDFIRWMKNGFTKVVLSVNSEEELLELYASLQKGVHRVTLPYVMITDAGLTEFNGVETKTCMAIGPYRSEVIDLYTGHLKLL